MKRIVGEYIFDPEMTTHKMIFLNGPRQVGKTIFARKWLDVVGSKETGTRVLLCFSLGIGYERDCLCGGKREWTRQGRCTM